MVPSIHNFIHFFKIGRPVQWYDLGPTAHENAGELVSGWHVAVTINQLAIGADGNELRADSGAVIVNAGQLRRGTPLDASQL